MNFYWKRASFQLFYPFLFFGLACTPKPEPFLLGLLALPLGNENAAFQVLSTSPAANQVDVSTTTSVMITFNKNVDSTSITGNVSLTQPALNSISSLSANTSGKTVTLKPSSFFLSTSNYAFTLKSTIKATTGETLGSDFILTFTTQ
jgi:hypothetical protein